MKTHQTTAVSAEQELTEILGSEGRLYKDGILDEHEIVPVRLQTTYEEALLLLFENSIVRPGFKVEEGSVDYPCLFFKVNGAVDWLLQKAHAWRASHGKTTLLYSNFYLIGRAPQTSALQNAQQYGADVSKIDSLSFLSANKQKQLGTAYQQTLEWAKQSGITLSTDEICATCLYDSTMIIDALHNVVAQQSNAKCFINIVQKSKISQYAAVRILFMHALAFDVVITSKNNYATIESLIADELYDLHIATAEATTKTKKRPNIWKALAIGGALLGLVYLLSRFL